MVGKRVLSRPREQLAASPLPPPPILRDTHDISLSSYSYPPLSPSPASPFLAPLRHNRGSNGNLTLSSHINQLGAERATGLLRAPPPQEEGLIALAVISITGELLKIEMLGPMPNLKPNFCGWDISN